MHCVDRIAQGHIASATRSLAVTDARCSTDTDVEDEEQRRVAMHDHLLEHGAGRRLPLGRGRGRRRAWLGLELGSGLGLGLGLGLG